MACCRHWTDTCDFHRHLFAIFRDLCSSAGQEAEYISLCVSKKWTKVLMQLEKSKREVRNVRN